ncbi:hypothetical protein CMUS01_11962 [Colletotrichum musicola]|uniref:Uncharacterized protein n=1 Tax=Colletotrichum musicola TaxID=2175873 RepID=A0A8H6JRV3_9PEZI|nr:hypothetical protein CMUS01_11962 [Colletotrichum musicola]
MRPTLRRLVVLCFLLFAVAAASPTSANSPPESPPFKCPTHIDTVVPGGQDESQGYGQREPGDTFLPTMREVHYALSNCSTIKSLKLRVAHLGCTRSPDSYTFPLEFPRGSHYPSKLETLDLDGYDFNEKPWDEGARLDPSSWFESEYDRYRHWFTSGKARNWLKWLPLSKAQKNMTNLDLWLEAMDFSGIKTLRLRQMSDRGPEIGGVYTREPDPDLARLVPHLKSLESLTVRGDWAKDFILALPKNSLKHLSWINSSQTGASVEPILRHHAASLRSLEWREPEADFRRRRVMTADQIAALGSMAPDLRKLTFDMNQNRTWPYEHLEVLATKFPKLTNATTFMEMTSECRRQIESSTWDFRGQSRQRRKTRQARKAFHETIQKREAECKSYSQPELNANHTKHLFEFLVAKNKGGNLTSVSFYAGYWERGWDGPPRFVGPWIEDHRAWGSCWLAEDSEPATEAKIEGGESRQMTCRTQSWKGSKRAGSDRWVDDEDGSVEDWVTGWRLLKGELCEGRPLSCLS